MIGPKEIPKYLGYIGKMIAKVKGVTRELQDTVDDAIQNSELEDIRKEISLTDPELSKNLKEIMEPDISNNISSSSNVEDDKTDDKVDTYNSKKNEIDNSKTRVAKEDLPTGLKHIRNNDLDESENLENKTENKT